MAAENCILWTCEILFEYTYQICPISNLKWLYDVDCLLALILRLCLQSILSNVSGYFFTISWIQLSICRLLHINQLLRYTSWRLFVSAWCCLSIVCLLSTVTVNFKSHIFKIRHGSICLPHLKAFTFRFLLQLLSSSVTHVLKKWHFYFI